MNKQLFRKIADAIEKNPQDYNQELWSCNTQKCIGGWAVFLELPKVYRKSCHVTDSTNHVGLDDYKQIATKLLGISAKTAEVLFDSNWKPTKNRTVPQALREIAAGKTASQVTCKNTRERNRTWHGVKRARATVDYI